MGAQSAQQRERSAIAAGTKLDGKYLVRRRLGAGGFGEVFLAGDEAIPDRQVAIKVLAEPRQDRQGALLREMQMLAKFRHPGVVAFYHHFLYEDRLFLVMEFCPGGSLSDRLHHSGAVPETEAFQLCGSLCDTLAFVHDKGIVHHDIKPANILFDDEAKVKLGDFGVANTRIGTIQYLPPEAFLGRLAADNDPRADIYSLGITTVEMLLGRHPFHGLADRESVQARFAHDFIPDALPRWAQEVLLKATHPAPELRFQTMREFAESIRGRSVPYVFDSKRVKAHAVAEKANALIARRKWSSAARMAETALQMHPDCVAALLAAGKCYLLTRRLERAEECFARAAAVNPRAHVQKELGWLNLERGRLPTAISMLTDHLQRNASDFDACNLLLKCFYLSDRFEAAAELARTLLALRPPGDCFRSNLFIFGILNEGCTNRELEPGDTGTSPCPFLSFNREVVGEQPPSWNPDSPPLLRSKLIFEEYRFGIAHLAGRTNPLLVHPRDVPPLAWRLHLVTIGSLPTNDLVVGGNSVSRRHAAIVNLPDEVWVYDLGSTCGTFVDGARVEGRRFVDGVHELRVGRESLRLAANANLLL